jgi:hypothetical protein
VQRILELFLRTYTYLSVSFTLIGFAVSLVREPHAPLQAHLARAIAAGGIPCALVLIVGAFVPDILSKVKGLEVAIAFGGMALLYVSLICGTKVRARGVSTRDPGERTPLATWLSTRKTS